MFGHILTYFRHNWMCFQNDWMYFDVFWMYIVNKQVLYLVKPKILQDL